LVGGHGEVLDEGTGTVEVTGGALVLAPAAGEVLRIAPADIAELSEPEPYAVRLRLTGGAVLDLDRLGAMRTQILAELGEARAGALATTTRAAGVGEPEVFPGWLDGTEAELRLYDDALVLLPARGDAEKIPYPFLAGVSTDASGYRITVEVAGRAPLTLQRLARRTTEFVDLLQARRQAASGRTAAFLGALLPGLDPVALRSAAALLRDGRAAAHTDLDAIEPSVWPALTTAATRPERVGCLRELDALGPGWLGFKQLVSVHRAAVGGSGWHDPARPPDLTAREPAGPAGFGFGGPFQALGPALAYTLLGTAPFWPDGAYPGGFPGAGFPGSGFAGSGFAGSGFAGSGFAGSGFAGAGFPGSGFPGSGGGQHEIRPRADMERDRLTPAYEDVGALTAAGERPTVLAFTLHLAPGGRLVYEVLNDPGPATHVYRLADPAVLNRALDLLGFRVEDLPIDDRPDYPAGYAAAVRALPALGVLRDAYAGRIAHDGNWSAELARHLS
jgi:hypothetical protein